MLYILTSKDINLIEDIVNQREHTRKSGKLWIYPKKFMLELRGWVESGCPLRLIAPRLQINEIALSKLVRGDSSNIQHLVEDTRNKQLVWSTQLSEVVIVNNLASVGCSVEEITNITKLKVDTVSSFISIVDNWRIHVVQGESANQNYGEVLEFSMQGLQLKTSVSTLEYYQLQFVNNLLLRSGVSKEVIAVKCDISTITVYNRNRKFKAHMSTLI